MTYRVLTDLADVLRRGGCNVIEYPGWQTRGRPPYIGQFDPQGVLCHHTASPDSWPDSTDIACILAGNSAAPGPISQLFQSRFAPWPVYVIASGRANHGGGGRRPGIDVNCADMNRLLIGIEAGQSGSTYWPDGMTTHYAKVVAALLSGYGWTVNDVFLHATTGPPSGGCNSKIDPSGPWQRETDLALNNPGATTWNLGAWRRFVSEHLGSSPSPGPTPGGEDMHVIYESIDAGGNRWAWADFMGIEDGNGICESVVWLPGDYKAQIEAAASGPLPHRRRGPGGYRTFRLEGTDFSRMNGEDQAYDWSPQPGRDFRYVSP